MEINSNEKQLLDYLNRYYCIKENVFFVKEKDVQEWGYEITHFLSKVFSFEEEFCVETIKFWGRNNGLTNELIEKAWGIRKLKTNWSPELAQDLEAYGVLNAEQNLIRELSEKIENEINCKILKDLEGKIKTGDEFLSIMKCIGYVKGPTIVDATSFVPVTGFVSAKIHEIKDERQNNTLWQNWVRTRK